MGVSLPNFSRVAREIFKHQASTKVTFAMLDQRQVIKFLVKEQNRPKEVHRRLTAIYGDGQMKRKQVYW
jgi:hypothetical protein